MASMVQAPRRGLVTWKIAFSYSGLADSSADFEEFA